MRKKDPTLLNKRERAILDYIEKQSIKILKISFLILKII